MTTIQRIPVVWNGLAGLPGVSVHYGVLAGSAVADLKAFFTAIKALFPASLTWQVPVSGDTIDDASGRVNGTWADAAGGIVTSTGSGIWAQGTGMMVRWDTSAIHNGRRVKGRTFLCPMFGSAFQTDGTIIDAYVATVHTAADALVAGGDAKIFTRPPKGTFSGGSSAVLSGALAEDRVTSLRSRRH